MALADSGVDVARWVSLFEFAQAGAVGHGGRQGNDTRIIRGQFNGGVGEGGRPTLAVSLFDLDPATILLQFADNAEGGGAVEAGRLVGRNLVAVAFAGFDVQQHRSFDVLNLREK